MASHNSPVMDERLEALKQSGTIQCIFTGTFQDVKQHRTKCKIGTLFSGDLLSPVIHFGILLVLTRNSNAGNVYG